MSDILANSLTCGTKGTKSVEHIAINLARIRLAGDDESGLEAGLLSYEFVKLLDFGVVSREYLKERCL